MGYEDDIPDAHDLDSIDDDYYSGGTPMDSEDSVTDSDFVNSESDDPEDITSHRQQFELPYIRYIGTSISDGLQYLMLWSPDPSCDAVVGEDKISVLASDVDNKKYSCYLLSSYIEDNRKAREKCEY